MCLCVDHDREPCKNSQTDPGAIYGMDSGGPKELCVSWGLHCPMGRGTFHGRNILGCAHACWPVDILKVIRQAATRGDAASCSRCCSNLFQICTFLQYKIEAKCGKEKREKEETEIGEREGGNKSTMARREEG